MDTHPSVTLGVVKRFARRKFERYAERQKLANCSNPEMDGGDPLVEALRALAEQNGGHKAVAERADVSADNLWQILNGVKLPSGRERRVGPNLRDKLSAAFPGWLSSRALVAAAPARDDSDEETIPQYDAGGSMGHGLVLEETPPGLIKAWRVDHEWLRLNVRHHTGVKNLCIVTGFGPSMRGMFNPGDPLLCDRGVRRVDVDGVYFFRVDNHGFIKILQRIPTADGVILRAKSKNPDYDPFDITKKVVESEGFEVFGKILTVWKSEQF